MAGISPKPAGKAKYHPAKSHHYALKSHYPVKDQTSALIPMPNPTPTGAHETGIWDWIGHEAEGAGSYISGHAKSVGLTIIDLIPLKPDSPYSVALLKHYVEASGDPYVFPEIPKDWQQWIIKATAGKPGFYKDLSPYNSGIYDLRNSLGHFDVTVTQDKHGSKTYLITDVYEFGYKKNDKTQQGRHGFPVGSMDESTLSMVRRLLPSKEYLNPGGFKEHWEIKKVGNETFLFIPQQFLAEQGKPFPVKGTFTEAPEKSK